ncbi:MFS transporter [Bythopirellula polymerisocia]|uniref:Putative sulfoacetate transporter SauU n=1 Tax=Bythopirellula polymerisocia TaxID=2528003 RepID=A0A5C6CAP0_9BACT|nr:MFS transporter [Bythopirellula polymerisocia]TWU21783.1 putative sulfoacetate transporter SauU [Bythopirellula polymerisocia]
MEVRNKATRIELFSLKTRPMRAFHMSWFAFFLCFFAWFGIAPLMAIVRDELGLTKEQIGNTIIASVAITIFARLFIGWLCDRIGPRLSYTFLLMTGSIPVMLIGLANSYESFLLFRLGIGVIGASFVITQYHTSVMFAPNVVGTANATSAGWGNLGGGVTQMIMPLVFAFFIWLGYGDPTAWRLSMVAAGAVCFVTGVAYYFFTTDLPDGNFKELRASGEISSTEKGKGSFWLAARDYRVWALFLVYAACFGVELTINNIAAIYYMDYFDLGLKTAGLVAGLFGLMNIFARTLGGFISDRFVRIAGLKGRVQWLFFALLVEGFALLLFSQMQVLALAIPTMIVFSLFVQMSEGATFSVVPFINKKALGSVAGIVGAGGNMGAVCAGFLFRSEGLSYPQALLILGGAVCVFSFSTLLVKFSPAAEKEAADEFDLAMTRRREELKDRKPLRELIPGIRHLRPMDALRIYLGVALFIKGIYFITNMAELESTLGEGLGQGQTMIAWSVVFAHIIGGACLMLGFVTRVAAAANALILFGAVLFSLGGTAASESVLGTNVDFQFTAFVFFTLVLFVWRGSGPLSLDHLLRLDVEAEPEIVL